MNTCCLISLEFWTELGSNLRHGIHQDSLTEPNTESGYDMYNKYLFETYTKSGYGVNPILVWEPDTDSVSEYVELSKLNLICSDSTLGALGLDGDAQSMDKTASPTPSLSKREEQLMAIIDKVEDEVDKQLLKDPLIEDPEELTVGHVASNGCRWMIGVLYRFI